MRSVPLNGLSFKKQSGLNHSLVAVKELRSGSHNHALYICECEA